MTGSLLSLSLHILNLTPYYGNSYLLGYFGFFLGMVFASGEEYFQSKKKLEEYSKNLEMIINEKMREIENKNLILLEEAKRIITLEKENAINKEREKIFADNIIYLQLYSLTNWDTAKISSGNGHKTIQSRTLALKGNFRRKLKKVDTLQSLNFR